MRNESTCDHRHCRHFGRASFGVAGRLVPDCCGHGCVSPGAFRIRQDASAFSGAHLSKACRFGYASHDRRGGILFLENFHGCGAFDFCAPSLSHLGHQEGKHDRAHLYGFWGGVFRRGLRYTGASSRQRGTLACRGGFHRAGHFPHPFGAHLHLGQRLFRLSRRQTLRQTENGASHQPEQNSRRPHRWRHRLRGLGRHPVRFGGI